MLEESAIEPKVRIMQGTLSSVARSAIAALTLLSACSSNRQQVPPPAEDRAFTEEDKRAARALSLSNNQAITDATSPYARALLCRNGIEALAVRFQGVRGPGMAEQRQAMEQVRAYIGEQLRLLAEREGKSGAELNGDMKETQEQHADPTENAQIALACLRRLQEAM